MLLFVVVAGALRAVHRECGAGLAASERGGRKMFSFLLDASGCVRRRRGKGRHEMQLHPTSLGDRSEHGARMRKSVGEGEEDGAAVPSLRAKPRTRCVPSAGMRAARLSGWLSGDQRAVRGVAGARARLTTIHRANDSMGVRILVG